MKSLHHTLERFLDEYIADDAIAADPDGPLFRTAIGKSDRLTGEALWQ